MLSWIKEVIAFMHEHSINIVLLLLCDIFLYICGGINSTRFKIVLSTVLVETRSYNHRIVINEFIY